MMKKIILLTGATGKQGGAVASHLLRLPSSSSHTIRALTRNPSSPAAQKLASQGIEVVKGDMYKPEELQSALKVSFQLQGHSIDAFIGCLICFLGH